MKSLIFKFASMVVLLLSLLVISAPPAYASSFNGICNSPNAAQSAQNSALCKDNPQANPVSGVGGIIDKVTNIITIIAGIAAVIMIILAGLEFVFSGGESQRVSTARNTIIFAVVGIIVIILARTIIVFVVSKVT